MSCHCLCSVNHPDDRGICTNESNGTLRFSQFPKDSPLAEFEYWDVGMCDPCRKATMKVRAER